jgi:uncharacterized 2Fe-2S/4Fe-4S cluster protein (DUF4445 family)
MADRVDKKRFRATFLPFGNSVEVPEGTTIAGAVKKAGLPLSFPCGGEGTCGGCVVRIIKGKYEMKPTAAHSASFRKEGYVLACQTKMNGDLTIALPHFQQLEIKTVVDTDFFRKNKDALSGIYAHDPSIFSVELEVPPPTLEDNYSDAQRLERIYRKNQGTKTITWTLTALSNLARALRSRGGKVRAVIHLDRNSATILDVFPASKGQNVFGIACDIGTSTVALHLVDLDTGEIACTASSLNQQIKCGEDIISRINYSQKPGHLQELQNLIVNTINDLIRTAIEKTGISAADIYAGAFSGNTTMSHLFLHLDPHFIREEPYVPTFSEMPFLPAKEIGLIMNPEARITLAPSVGSYVGGDITAGLLCTPLLKNSQKISLFLDAGTNGELVIGNREWLMTCACSAGPAFEGGGIRCGMPASEGAIETIQLNEKGQVKYRVIGGTRPKGICGSGLVDLLAGLFIHGTIDRQGKFTSDSPHRRIAETDEGRAFIVEEASKTYWGKDICITERDIANLIRTKGAVYSALSLLMKNIGLAYDNIDSIYIAGGFGQHLDVENAIRIGLLPDLSRDLFHFIGNSSLSGSYMTLVCDKNKALIRDIIKKMTYIELNTEPSYMNEFTGSLFLPHTDMSLFPSVEKYLKENKE